MGDSRLLIERAGHGDRAALQSLLVRHMPALEAYVRLHAGQLVRAKESCSDLVQSVCLAVLADLDGFEYRGESQFRHWLFKQALHKIINKNRFYKAGKRDAGLERPLESPLEPALEEGLGGTVYECYASICTPSRVARGREALERFEQAFDRLPEERREAITLYRIVGLTYKEIAETMARSEGAVRNLIYRGLAQLSTLLADDTD